MLLFQKLWLGINPLLLQTVDTTGADVTAESLSLLNMLKAFKNLEELVIHRHGNNNSKTKEKKRSEKNSLQLSSVFWQSQL